MKYSVIYSYQTDNGSGTGRMYVTCDTPIDTEERLDEVEALICQNNPEFTVCFVTNLIELKA